MIYDVLMYDDNTDPDTPRSGLKMNPALLVLQNRMKLLKENYRACLDGKHAILPLPVLVSQ